jgi:ABC-type Fe3+ transport system permease subunit
MIRIVIENILLFLLPTFVYVAYVYMTREEKPEATRVLNDAPLLWLFIAGAVLVVATLIAFGNVSGGKPGQHYTPSILKDGRIQPGVIE